MSKQVHYHQHGSPPLTLHIVKEHKGGKVDLAREEGGPAIITEIELSEHPAHGTAVPCEASAPKPSKRKAAKAPAAGAADTEGQEPAADSAPAESEGGQPPPPPEE